MKPELLCTICFKPNSTVLVADTGMILCKDCVLLAVIEIAKKERENRNNQPIKLKVAS